ncbi:zinc finger, c3HC4 type (RING finger) domain-containing protein [Hirsutella rhossiliensis]|uniref:Zinc finger, c3HC4 type (RING finger) domain-containing protein n=1 Tax=Hirsutella rhossiliensis TaxID=111463 RepID=A0A9P8SF37_9HYPO|nr:zinc finger, c3HC4 type (RING finger) domain-containing protein [Hirsutella rhossiliensis]KAH0960331.1 zinc finger, c3HC4 type (RING finger) domain-containing protein [Hirsutella rhossiliensis]
MEQHPRFPTLASLAPTPPASSLQAPSASGWYNLTGWVNVTRYAPFLEELVRAGPRVFMKLGSYMASSASLDTHSHHYASTTAEMLRSIAPDPNTYNILRPSDSAAPSLGSSGEDIPMQPSALPLEGARGLGSVFSYATSKWALSCIAMAIILNRTHIFAATRRRVRFRWHIRLLLRLSPILLLVMQVYRLLQSIQCQTSPDFARLRWGDEKKSSELMFSHPNAWLNTLSSTLLLGATDEQSCVAVGMTPQQDQPSSQPLQGSLPKLWPLFGTFCLSHFLETISCAVQGRAPASETGMTLFEQSLAFAEADAAVSNQLGWAAFANPSRASGKGESELGSAIALTRSMVLKGVNAAPEVLLVAFLSSMAHITSQILGVFDLQARFRLVNTGLWGICFMASIVWSVFSFELGNPSALGLLRFPTVCIIGFVPHVLVLAGIIACLCIYGLALFLSALVPSTEEDLPPSSFRQRLAHAHSNMQANISLSDIRVTREMDFYTALLRTGFSAITMASEAVYLNEDRGVSLQRHTWLEEARLREVEEIQRQCIGMGLPNSGPDQAGTIGLIPIKTGSVATSNGYARERAAQKLPKSRGERGLRFGTGATERSSRWLMAMEFLFTIGKLVARVCALTCSWMLGKLRIRAQPAWLLWLARRPKPEDESSQALGAGHNSGGRRLPAPDGQAGFIPTNDGIDVEAEFRLVSGFADEESLELDLYRYWLKGGWWGSSDSSGDFKPHSADDDWDNTSVVSTTSTTDGIGDEQPDRESDDDGQRTPTRTSPFICHDGSTFNDCPLGMSDLARLLHPTSREDRDDAQRLAAHLQSDQIVTRAGYRGLGGRMTKLGPDDEERLLEQILLSRRRTLANSGSHAPDRNGAYAESPPCVVCQSSPRTIIVWPCRCLSLCDDCRVSLAMNNFDKCVCCRRDVMSFSRIFVP